MLVYEWWRRDPGSVLFPSVPAKWSQRYGLKMTKCPTGLHPQTGSVLQSFQGSCRLWSFPGTLWNRTLWPQGPSVSLCPILFFAIEIAGPQLLFFACCLYQNFISGGRITSNFKIMEFSTLLLPLLLYFHKCLLCLFITKKVLKASWDAGIFSCPWTQFKRQACLVLFQRSAQGIPSLGVLGVLGVIQSTHKCHPG
jgi:hypothetical protein